MKGIQDAMIWIDNHEFFSTVILLAASALFFGLAGLLSLGQRRKQHHGD